MIKSKKIGLVLSGGGYRGAAHAGVFKALEELEIKPDLVAGTSAGAIMGTFFAAGYDWKSPPDLSQHNILSKNNLEEIFNMGYVEAMEKLSTWKKEN